MSKLLIPKGSVVDEEVPHESLTPLKRRIRAPARKVPNKLTILVPYTPTERNR